MKESVKNEGSSHVPSEVKLPHPIQEKAEEPSAKEKKVKKYIAGVALLFIIYYLIRSGVAKKVIVEYIFKSRLVRWVLLLLFNYRFSKTPAVKTVN